jgi:hypothetical protein
MYASWYHRSQEKTEFNVGMINNVKYFRESSKINEEIKGAGCPWKERQEKMRPRANRDIHL